MSTLKAITRHRQIVEMLGTDGRVDVINLSETLGVSTVTVRADLLILEKSQILRRVRGGAIAMRPSRYERPVDLNASLRGAEKTAIAAIAADMIRDGETILMDTGSTIAALAGLIPDKLTDLAVVTNSLNVAIELSPRPNITVIVTGGTVRPKLNSLVSPFGTLLLDRVNADVAFISCAGVDTVKGFTNSNWHEAEIKQKMMAAASRVVMLADHSKLKHVATAKIADLDQVDLLITDQGASPAAVKELRAAGLEVVLA
ncbi:DeoR/GlpR family DNA-binding transcription regulator [Pseudoruegeria sp. SK021]|uniref:DeoR/GlpR family DNA-binding transcription regulator n=1 Tax=Pseudoruegeria sp. SK021 TaxID=1933035 RepID=UPI000A21695C|nr:DeoR/GlpR family DNA-binding transcription regulator [Pseudoruegeria sp. SK021]OSP54722.1 hypothetical protein BV911_11195 [Pseudoruegeria sp. SK021]